jgi:hypothetical protein
MGCPWTMSSWTGSVSTFSILSHLPRIRGRYQGCPYLPLILIATKRRHQGEGEMADVKDRYVPRKVLCSARKETLPLSHR